MVSQYFFKFENKLNKNPITDGSMILKKTKKKENIVQVVNIQ